MDNKFFKVTGFVILIIIFLFVFSSKSIYNNWKNYQISKKTVNKLEVEKGYLLEQLNETKSKKLENLYDSNQVLQEVGVKNGKRIDIRSEEKENTEENKVFEKEKSFNILEI